VPVGRLPWNRTRFGVLAGGKQATTHYRVISNFKSPVKQKEELSLLELYPKTGRTHQIRVHLKYLNHPIFGDELYAGRKTARDDRKVLQRFFLHAKKISFFHPQTEKRVEFESPLPEELQNMLEVLGR
jgi:23S rRNA pseudouridine1911/1915/1917 synthase